MLITKKQEKELKQTAGSLSLRNDLMSLRAMRHNPFVFNGKVDIDRFITFLNEYNSFINHTPKPFKKIIDRVMKL